MIEYAIKPIVNFKYPRAVHCRCNHRLENNNVKTLRMEPTRGGVTRILILK